LLRSAAEDGGWQEETWLRFVDGRPVSAATTEYLAWCRARLQAAGKEALLLVRDNAPWHVSRHVRAWIRAHNRRVQWSGRGVRIIACSLPIKSPWLYPIEMLWRHFRREVTHGELFETMTSLLAAAADFFARYNQEPQRMLSIIGAKPAIVA
jgi:hypothetical protein